MKVFFIVYTARTGSTTLYMHLDQHPNLAVIGDLFQKKDLTGSWAQGLGRRVANCTLAIDEYMDKVIKTLANEETRAVGLKIAFNWFKSGNSSLQDLKMWTRKKRPHIIHVERLNKAEQEISHQLAMARDQFHLLPGETARQVPILVRPMHLSNRIRHLTNMNQGIVNRFSRGFPYIRITYEDFIAKTDDVVNRICDFLDVPHMDSLPLPTRKISPRDLSTVIKNYKQVEKFL